VIFLPIPDAAVRLADLRSGSVDLIERLSPSDLAEIAKSEALATAATTELGYQSINLNVAKAPSHFLEGLLYNVPDGSELAIKVRL
jgi:peptide/nickel transport system substrate-binding protein